MSDYLRQLRAKVGHDLLVAPSVAVVAFDAAGGVLLVRHVESGRWGLPGGAVEPCELPADVGIRETWEETGVRVAPVRLLGVYGGPELHVRYRNGDEVAYVATVFEARVLGGVPRPDGVETHEARFVAPGELASLDLAAWVRRVLDDLRRDPGGAHFQPATPTDGVP
jgi:8-oxo-dGTP pyrophosphatase MutT (NUDIX family)